MNELEEAPPETQKTLLQTVVKQVQMEDRRKVAGIELEFDPTVQKHFFELAPSAKTAEGLLLSASKSPPPDTASFCDLKKLAEARLRRLCRLTWPIPNPCLAMPLSKPAARFSEKTCR
ncbi:hypothetical protein J2Z66_006291 [Paenibacillus eucommiae]|uniref:Uncharacterized protein n=1 Tax=Paenibacillus eucommiae TaxID=1355755 RepID=A0ABS4J488_9BACL|nr:hypothetical protein [Paenibacillus eucommiae]